MPAIVTSGDINSYNSMVIGWGSIGVGFAKPIFTVYVKPERYIYQFMDKSDIFTVSYIDKKLFGKFGVYGSKSGKDMNKEEVSGTHIKFLDDGGITFEEAPSEKQSIVIFCPVAVLARSLGGGLVHIVANLKVRGGNNIRHMNIMETDDRIRILLFHFYVVFSTKLNVV